MANKLVLELIADSNNLIKGLQQAQTAVKKFSDSAAAAGGDLGNGVNRALQSFTNLASGGAVAAGVLAGALVAVGGAAVVMAINAGRQAEELQQLGKITGISTDKLQDYEVVLHRAGLTGNDLVQVMKHVSTSLDQARQNTGSASDRFKQLGIDISKVTSTDQLIRKIATSASQFADGTEKAAIMSDLLGKGWATFIKAFDGGTKAMDDAARASENLGAKLSGGQLAELATMDDHVDDLGKAWERFGQQLGSFVAPAVDLAARAMSNLLAMASNALKSLNSLGGVNTAADARPGPPKFIDAGKVAQRAQEAADVQLKVSQSLFKQEAALGQARLNTFQAELAAKTGLDLAADVQMSQANEAAQSRMADFTAKSLQTELQNYRTFFAQKLTLFLGDEKSQADKAKFEVEASGKIQELLNSIAMAQLQSDATRVASARKTSDLIKQLNLQPYDDAVAAAKVLDEAQQALFHSEAGLLGASDAARRVRMNLIEAEAARERVLINQTIMDETRKSQAIQNLDLQTETKRRQAIQAFPGFFEQQLNSIVASNQFSVGLIINSWTSGVANAIVTGGNFIKAAWQQTQIAIVQGTLNTGIQMAAEWLKQALVEEAIQESTSATLIAGHTALEAAKTSISATADAERTVASIFASKAMASASVAAVGAAGLAMVAVMEGVVVAIAGVFAAIGAGLAATIVGAPFAPAFEVAAGAVITAGTIATVAAGTAITEAITAGAVASLGPGFATGGIGNFGSGTPATLHGHEAIIPLNKRGASFMQDMLGGMGSVTGGSLTVQVMLPNGRELARAVVDDLPSALRRAGVPA